MTAKTEIECLLNDNHQKGKMMIMILKTSGFQVDSPVAEGRHRTLCDLTKVKKKRVK